VTRSPRWPHASAASTRCATRPRWSASSRSRPTWRQGGAQSRSPGRSRRPQRRAR
jgi:hypothetical protein